LPAAPEALPGALLLSGQSGLGKRETALFIARGLLCETSRAGLGACGSCASCLLVAAGNHPDLNLVELEAEEGPDVETEMPAPPTSKKPARQIPVARVRSLGEFVTRTSHRGRAKVILIAPAEALHPSAANALLKMLEEPPAGTRFLLVSHRPERLLATIRSRCFQVPFTLPEPRAALAWLKAQGAGQPELSLAQGGYAPLAAADRAGDGEYWTQRRPFLELLARPGFNPVQAAEKGEPIEGPVLARLLSQWAYDIAALKAGRDVRYHLDFRQGLQRLANQVSGERLMHWYDQVLQYGRVAEHPLNKRLALEQLLSAYPAPS
jgi:DNA polymerase-3 subunit delta'